GSVRYENLTTRNSLISVGTGTLKMVGAYTSGTRTLHQLRLDRPINCNAAGVDLQDVAVSLSSGASDCAPFVGTGTTTAFSTFSKIFIVLDSTFSGGGNWKINYGATVDLCYHITRSTANP